MSRALRMALRRYRRNANHDAPDGGSGRLNEARCSAPRMAARLAPLKRETRRAGSQIVRRETRRGASLLLAASSRYGSGMAGPTGDVGEVDEHLAGMGYASGVRGVVRRFREHRLALQELALRWRSEPQTKGAPLMEVAEHPGGLFLLEVMESGSGRLVHSWPGWGRRTLGTGSAEHLRAEALRILRGGGPFGGPTIARTGDHIVQVREPQSGMRQTLPDGSEARIYLLAQRALLVRIWPNGQFAPMTIVKTADEATKLIEDDAEHLSLGSTRVPWIFTDMHPLIGTIRADPYDLLLCPLRVDLAVLIAVKGEDVLGLKIGVWDELRSIDAGPWLTELDARAPKVTPPEAAAAGKKAKEATSAAHAATAKQKKAEPTAAPNKSGSPGAQATEKPASKQRKRAAMSPGGMPGPRERRVRIKPALAAAITQHLASVAAELPAGVLGAAFAAELLRALEAAALGDHPTLTGKTIELFSRLHKRGFLASVPADQAGRAALKLLAERTPLVRRLHYRRWCFAFGDIHNPTSALRVRLGPIE